MSSLEAVETRLSFEDILEAVQDSRRGRWFLQEYETRIQKRDSQSILQAISRLENRMESLGPKAGTPDELQKVRSAIANARGDLLKLGLGKEAMSKEGRLFAELAEMARKSMPVAVDSNAGIVRTLQLVAEIDSAMDAAPALPEDRGSKYFAADSDLFARGAAAAKPVLVTNTVAEAAPEIQKPPKPVVKVEEPAAVGARLVIRKASQPVSEPAPVELTQTVQPAEFAAVPATAPLHDMPAVDTPRIVIIRRKAEDMPEVDVETPHGTETAA